MAQELTKLERAVEKYVKEIDTANKDIKALIATIREIEEMATDADALDLRKASTLKTDLNRLKTEVQELVTNIRALEKELSDTNSKIRKATM